MAAVFCVSEAGYLHNQLTMNMFKVSPEVPKEYPSWFGIPVLIQKINEKRKAQICDLSDNWYGGKLSKYYTSQIYFPIPYKTPYSQDTEPKNTLVICAKERLLNK